MSTYMKLAAAAVLFGAGVQVAGSADNHLPPALPPQSSLLPAMDVATHQPLAQQQLMALQTQQATTRHRQPMVESNQEIADKLIATVGSRNVEPDCTAVAAAIDRFTDVVTSPRDQKFPAREKRAP